MKKTYNEVLKRIKKIIFSRLWPGFFRFRFALYDDERVCIDGNIFPKDDRFLGNTAIKYNDEFLAIWDMKNSFIEDADILASKLVHEMFHAFQHLNGEERWANELAGLNYRYEPRNLSIKIQENRLLKSLHERFDWDEYLRFFALRKLREKHYPQEIDYEARVEVIEGMANFVEFLALKQLDRMKYFNVIEKLKARVVDVCNLIPVRHMCYDVGALLLLVCDENGIPFKHGIGETEKTVYEILSEDLEIGEAEVDEEPAVQKLIRYHERKNENLIKEFISEKECRVRGKFRIYGFDPMNAVRHGDYLYSKHFIAYINDDDEIKFIKQENVSKLDEHFNILEIYY
ncbi:MAG: hypothetical protein WAP91_00680 [Bacilli bacterium]